MLLSRKDGNDAICSQDLSDLEGVTVINCSGKAPNWLLMSKFVYGIDEGTGC